jgi:twitching motility protein PilU
MQLDAIMDSFIAKRGSDLFFTYGYPPAMRVEGQMVKLDDNPIDDDALSNVMQTLLTEDQIDEFEGTLEYNTIKSWQGAARLRVNVFRQQQHNAFAIRRVETRIPSIDEMALPQIYKDLIMAKRGLVLVVGQTGCGKSTSLAAMIGHRNTEGQGHIITIEDPIEYVHQHNRCIISQRDVGIDTYSFGMALKNALRQTPDVILIGEIRDRETMESAIAFAETGHLCVSTLHSNNANQAIERILNFFPVEVHRQVLANLSFNLRGIISQRLVENLQGTRSPAVEVLLNEGIIRDHIHSGHINHIKEEMEKHRDHGMQSFDQSLLDLYVKGLISEEVAFREADSAPSLRMRIQQRESASKFHNAASQNVGGGMASYHRPAQHDF